MSTRGKVLFLALLFFLFSMSVGVGCPRALSETAMMSRHMPANIGPLSGARAHSQVPASAMHALNAPVRARHDVVTGRVAQSEKRVLIHGAAMLRSPHLAD